MKENQDIQDEIRKVVLILTNRYHTRNPFFIAENIGIKYTFLNLDYQIPAFCERRGTKDPGRIYINRKYRADVRELLCAHELGHLSMHGNDCDTFFTPHANPEKEYEANYFAVTLLPYTITDKEALKQSIEKFNSYIINYVRQGSLV